jgi:phosphatidylglycerol:prolipoprotein diacylglycerol transferase
MGLAAFPLAVIAFDFSPYLVIGDSAIRWESIGIAAAVLAGIVWLAVLAGRTPGYEGWIGDEEPREAADLDDVWHLRRDDLLFIVLGAVPGAVVLGRAFYGLAHLDYYAADPHALLDPALGAMSLSGAVLGGILTAAYVAALLDTPVGRWLHIAAGPVILTLALGKMAMALGGSGQGTPSDLPWATAYLGPGPWGSIAPAVPSHPSQLYEAGAAVLVLVVVLLLARSSLLRRADSRLFAAAIALWASARAAVAMTWRDPAVLGPFGAEQLLTLGLAAIMVAWLAASVALGRGEGERPR